jgi:hypothetical protein
VVAEGLGGDEQGLGDLVVRASLGGHLSRQLDTA